LRGLDVSVLFSGNAANARKIYSAKPKESPRWLAQKHCAYFNSFYLVQAA